MAAIFVAPAWVSIECARDQDAPQPTNDIASVSMTATSLQGADAGARDSGVADAGLRVITGIEEDLVLWDTDPTQPSVRDLIGRVFVRHGASQPLELEPNGLVPAPATWEIVPEMRAEGATFDEYSAARSKIVRDRTRAVLYRWSSSSIATLQRALVETPPDASVMARCDAIERNPDARVVAAVLSVRGTFSRVNVFARGAERHPRCDAAAYKALDGSPRNFIMLRLADAGSACRDARIDHLASLTRSNASLSTELGKLKHDIETLADAGAACEVARNACVLELDRRDEARALLGDAGVGTDASPSPPSNSAVMGPEP